MEKACYPVSIGSMAVAILVGGVVNAALTFLGLLICMPCMASDALGGLALVRYMKRGGKTKLTRIQAVLLGALSALLGSLLFMTALILIFLLFGNLAGMLSSTELLGRSISGTDAISGWAVVIVGFLLITFKMLIGAIAVAALSTLE